MRTVTLDPDGLVSMGATEGEIIVFVTQSHGAPRARWPETKVFACVIACMCACVCEKEDNALDGPWNYSHGWGLMTYTSPSVSPSVWLIKFVLPAFFHSYTYKNAYSIPYLWICSMWMNMYFAKTNNGTTVFFVYLRYDACHDILGVIPVNTIIHEFRYHYGIHQSIMVFLEVPDVYLIVLQNYTISLS